MKVSLERLNAGDLQGHTVVFCATTISGRTLSPVEIERHPLARALLSGEAVGVSLTVEALPVALVANVLNLQGQVVGSGPVFLDPAKSTYEVTLQGVLENKTLPWTLRFALPGSAPPPPPPAPQEGMLSKLMRLMPHARRMPSAASKIDG